MQISKDTAFQKFSGSDLFGALQSGSVIFCIKFILHIFVFYGSFFNIFYMFIFTVYFFFVCTYVPFLCSGAASWFCRAANNG